MMQRQLRDSQVMTHYAKFGQLLTHSSQKFQDVYTLAEQMTIDEAICPFQRHISLCVYIKGKPHKYGLKIFELCEAKSGYVYNLEVQREASARPEKLSRNTLHGTAENAMLDFV
jgi:hypothetical protein